MGRPASRRSWDQRERCLTAGQGVLGVRHGLGSAETLRPVMELTARVMGGEVDDVDEVVEAGLAEHADGSGWALLFQRTDHEPDEQDIRLGMDSYCLTTGGGLTVYGGLRRAELDGRLLRLTLSVEAADILRLAEVVTVRLEVEAALRQVFVEMLPRVVLWGRSEERPDLVGFGDVSR